MESVIWRKAKLWNISGWYVSDVHISEKYSAENVTLIFPFTEKISAHKIIEFHSQDNVTVKVKFVDLFDIRKSLENIISEFGI